MLQQLNKDILRRLRANIGTTNRLHFNKRNMSRLYYLHLHGVRHTTNTLTTYHDYRHTSTNLRNDRHATYRHDGTNEQGTPPRRFINDIHKRRRNNRNLTLTLTRIRSHNARTRTLRQGILYATTPLYTRNVRNELYVTNLMNHIFGRNRRRFLYAYNGTTNYYGTLLRIIRINDHRNLTIRGILFFMTRSFLPGLVFPEVTHPDATGAFSFNNYKTLRDTSEQT